MRVDEDCVQMVFWDAFKEENMYDLLGFSVVRVFTMGKYETSLNKRFEQKFIDI